MHVAAIGIGSNQGDARANVLRAFERLGAVGTVVARSSLYRTQPWGVADQPDFVNAAALVHTALEPRALLDALKAIERDEGRTDGPRWGPRLLDLDILAFDEQAVDEPDLVIPHACLRERAFALVPLAEIDPRWRDDVAALSPGERASVVELDGQ